MDTYTYLILDVALLIPVFALLSFRKDLLRHTVKLGVYGGLAGFVAELFYFRDYWRPPTILGVAHISLEDFLFGFSITCLSVLMYPTLFKKHMVYSPAKQYKALYAIFCILGLLSLITGSLWLNINSIFVTSGVFLFYAFIMAGLRRDLFAVAGATATSIVILIIPLYLFVFGLVDPSFWQHYWLMQGKILGFYLVKYSVPLSEAIWYFCWSAFASISYPFVFGFTFVNKAENRLSAIGQQ